MRSIDIDGDAIREYLDDPQGRRMCVPVKVDWPELQLTLDQITANAVARLNGKKAPYPDHSLIEVTVDLWPAVMRGRYAKPSELTALRMSPRS